MGILFGFIGQAIMNIRTIWALRHSLIMRLLFWHTLMVAVIFSCIFAAFYFHAVYRLRQHSATELRAQADDFAWTYRMRGLDELGREFAQVVRRGGTCEIHCTVLDAKGNTKLSSDTVQWDVLTLDRELLAAAKRNNAAIVKNMHMGKNPCSVQVAYKQLDAENVLWIAAVQCNDDLFLSHLLESLVGMGILVLITVILVGWLVLSKAMGRMYAVTQAALSISSTSLDQRVVQSGHNDEIDKLAKAFNGMLDRIESLVRGMTEVTDNVAHDLRSPLTRMRVTAESFLVSKKADAAARQTAEQIIVEIDRLLTMVNTILEIRAMDTGLVKASLVSIDVADVVRRACELFGIVAEEKNITVHLHNSEPAVIRGDLFRLERVFANLMDNAIKYTPFGGRIDVAVHNQQQAVQVSIADKGAGIDPKALKRIFERFYRADASRHTPGLGLGLSLAESIVKAHGGSITVQSELWKGSIFTVILPKPGDIGRQ